MLNGMGAWVVLAGPAPEALLPLWDPDEMRRLVAPIALIWQRAACEDFTALLGPIHPSAALPLCRLLYTLKLAAVASKLAAARWALQSLTERWSPLIVGALAGRHTPGCIEPWEEQQTLALIDDSVVRFRERLSPTE